MLSKKLDDGINRRRDISDEFWFGLTKIGLDHSDQYMTGWIISAYKEKLAFSEFSLGPFNVEICPVSGLKK